MHKKHNKRNAYKGGIKYIDRKTYTVPLKLEAEENQCPVLVYVRSSDDVCLMELKVLCKSVLCLKER